MRKPLVKSCWAARGALLILDFFEPLSRACRERVLYQVQLVFANNLPGHLISHEQPLHSSVDYARLPDTDALDAFGALEDFARGPILGRPYVSLSISALYQATMEHMMKR